MQRVHILMILVGVAVFAALIWRVTEPEPVSLAPEPKEPEPFRQRWLGHAPVVILERK